MRESVLVRARLTAVVFSVGLAAAFTHALPTSAQVPSPAPSEPEGGGGGHDGWGGTADDPWCRRCVIHEGDAATGVTVDRPTICCSFGVLPAESARPEYRSMCQYLGWHTAPETCLAACGEACTPHRWCGDDIECDPNPCYSCTVAPGPLRRPTRLRAEMDRSGRVDLTWSDNSTAESGYRLYRARGTGSFHVLSEEPADATHAVDRTLTGAQWFTYRITAFGSSGESPSSNEVRVYSAEPRGAPTLRAPPPGCVSLHPRFEWTAVEEASRYRIEIFAEGADLTLPPDVLNGVTEKAVYESGGEILKAGQRYRWRVKATNGPFSGPYSEIREIVAGCATEAGS
jgi:hypothetical protein